MRRILLTILVVYMLLGISLAGCTAKIAIEADVAVPDSLRATTKISILGIKVMEQEVIGIGETVYVMNPKTKEWEVSHDYPDIGTMASLDVITVIMESLHATTIVNDLTSGDQTCYCIRGSLDSEVLDRLGFDDLSMEIEGYEDYQFETEGLDLEAELWIDRENYLVHQLMLEGRDAGEPDKTDTILQITMELTEFNKPVTVTEP
jgi:hypothetical protein